MVLRSAPIAARRSGGRVRRYSRTVVADERISVPSVTHRHYCNTGWAAVAPNSLAQKKRYGRLRAMRAAILPLLIGIAPVFALACSSSAGVAPDAGSSSSSGGGSGSSSGGNNDGGPQSGAFTQYSPVGCSYSYSPPSGLNFQNLAYDDQSPVSATAGVPERVRLGLGGGVTKG